MAKKPSKGRQKIKIAKIEIKNHLQVTFSKRRYGPFKKASELCTLCGVEIAIIFFFPVGRIFSFGHPSVDSIVDRFHCRNCPKNTTMRHLIEAHYDASARNLNSLLTQVLNELDAEKKKGGETLNHVRKLASQRKYWWEKPIDELGLNELEQLRDSIEELKLKTRNQANKIFVEGNVNPLPYFLAGVIETIDSVETKPYQINASSTAP